METSKARRSSFGRAALIVSGALLVLDTVFVFTRSSMTLGLILPALIGLPLLFIGIFHPAFRRACEKRRAVRAAAFALSLVYLAFGVLFTVTTGLILVNSSEPEDGADVLIVLGSGIRGDRPTLTMKYRLDAALDYLGRNPDAAVIVSGGMGRDERLSEAAVMKKYLVEHGVEESRVIEEDRSQSTEENFRFSGEIIAERFGSDAKAVFVTTRFHVFRSELTARREGLPIQGIPAEGVWYLVPNDYLRECVCIAWYFITGKI